MKVISRRNISKLKLKNLIEQIDISSDKLFFGIKARKCHHIIDFFQNHLQILISRLHQFL